MFSTGLIYYVGFLAAALFAKYLITLLLARAFNLKFPHGAAAANALSSAALGIIVAFVIIKLYEMFDLYIYVPGWEITLLFALLALLVSPIASLWVFTPEMDALRETNMKEWGIKIAVNLFLSVSLFFFAFAASVLAVLIIGGI